LNKYLFLRSYATGRNPHRGAALNNNSGNGD
jgi:hypothetical protein